MGLHKYFCFFPASQSNLKAESDSCQGYSAFYPPPTGKNFYVEVFPPPAGTMNILISEKKRSFNKEIKKAQIEYCIISPAGGGSRSIIR